MAKIKQEIAKLPFETYELVDKVAKELNLPFEDVWQALESRFRYEKIRHHAGFPIEIRNTMVIYKHRRAAYMIRKGRNKDNNDKTV